MEDGVCGFSYGIGGINEVLDGDAERVDSLDELEDFGEEMIHVPRLIGVYQKMFGDASNEMYAAVNKDVQAAVYWHKGSPDGVFWDLVCVGYDSSIMPRDVLKDRLGGDVLKRLNVVDYPELGGIDFSRKPEFMRNFGDIIANAQTDPSITNVARVESAMNSVRAASMDYGLTRLEALGVLAADSILGNVDSMSIIRTSLASEN